MSPPAASGGLWADSDDDAEEEGAISSIHDPYSEHPEAMSDQVPGALIAGDGGGPEEAGRRPQGEPLREPGRGPRGIRARQAGREGRLRDHRKHRSSQR